ncbi:MAG: Ig-like domain-containing protein [Clostridia bacterium]|nr:Ig-like domain-containing protein [Clostridia bacterium]
MKSKKLTSLAVLMMSLVIMLGIFALPASAATSLSKATVTYEVYQTYTGKTIKPKVTVKLGSKKLTKDKSYTVSYSSNKSVGKGYITIKGKGSYKGTIKKGFYIQPKAVSSLKATAYSTKIKLSWSKATGAKGYQVYQYVNDSWKKLPTVSGTSCTVTGLDSVTTYKFRVRPYAKVGSKTIFGEYKTVSKSTTIGKPTTVDFSDVTESTATLKWNKIPGATSYNINYTNVSTGFSANATSATETITLTNLGKATDYKVKIRAVNTGKKITGNYSDVFTFSTSPAAVKITKAELTDESYIKLAWTASAGADSYTVYYSKVDANGNPVEFKEAGTVTATSATIKSLTPATIYIFKVVAFSANTSGNAYSSDALTDKFLIPVPKVVIKDAVASPTFTIFTWNRPSNIDGYNVYLDGELLTTLSAKETSYKFYHTPEDGKTYTLAFSAYYKDANGVTHEGEKTIIPVTTHIEPAVAVESVTITSKPSSAMKPGQTFTLGTSVLPSNASDKTLIFSSDNTSVATISQSGVITAVATGSAKITVKSKSNPDKSVSFNLSVRTSTVKATSISLPSEITMYEGDLLALNPTFTPADVTDKSFTVTGSDYTYSYKSGLFGTSTKTDTCKFDSYISITTSGLLKAKKATVEPKGDEKEFAFTVTVKTADGSNKTATTKVRVLPKMLTIQYNGMEDSPWYYGNSAQLSVSINSAISSDYSNSDIRFKSSNPSVATVSNVGVVTCKGSGETTITAYTSDNKHSATYEIFVRGIVSIDGSYFEACKPGSTYQIKAKILPENSDDILMYYSLNSDVATVAAGGLVTFHKSGNALIAVTTSSDPYNYKQVWLTSGTHSTPSGSNAQLLAQMKNAANSAKNFTDLPTAIIKEKHVFENLKASTTTGASADISPLEATIESIFPPITTFLSPTRSTKQDFIDCIPVKGQSYVFAPSLSESDLKSIKVTDNGEYYYEMTMVLKDETHTSLPTNPANTRHGKAFEIITQELYDKLKTNTGLNPTFDSLLFNYHDSSITLKINKVTGNLENITYNMITDATVKKLSLPGLLFSLNASATYKNIITVDFSGYKN